MGLNLPHSIHSIGLGVIPVTPIGHTQRPSTWHPLESVVTERTVSTMRLLLERQGLHLLLLVALVGSITVLADYVDAWEGQYRGLSTPTWFGLALGSAVAHQGWVWLCWRLELHTGWVTQTFGPAGFRLYATGFALLVAARIFLLIAVANSNPPCSLLLVHGEVSPRSSTVRKASHLSSARLGRC